MKRPHRRQFLHLAAGGAALPAFSRIARAQAYPSRPVRIVVPLPAGGAVDLTARLIGQWLSERLAQPFIIENRSGFNSNIATEAVVTAPPDGHTLLIAGSWNATNATFYDKLNFNFIRDIAPVAGMIRSPFAMVINAPFPAKTVAEFITYAKANPGKLNIAMPGGLNDISGELFKIMAGVDMTNVPYRGGAPALTDLLGGQVRSFSSVPGRSSTSAPASYARWR
jgi:tripartite-type tricarboxylate transporter receptor subunit TctC